VLCYFFLLLLCCSGALLIYFTAHLMPSKYLGALYAAVVAVATAGLVDAVMKGAKL